MIPVEVYSRIIDVLPILCVDIVIKNTKKEYLLVKRVNEPLKDRWWVIGGRVLKGESIEKAAIRKVNEEICLDIKHIRPIGYFEAPFQKHPFGLRTKYHAVSIVFSAVIGDHQQIKLDAQSGEWKFSKKLPSKFNINRFK